MKNYTSFNELSSNEQLQEIEKVVSDLAFKIAFFNDKAFNTDTFYRGLMLFHNRILFQLNKR